MLKITKYLSLTDPINETVQGNLSYSPGIFTANYTYLTPHDKSIPYYLVQLFYVYPGHIFYKLAAQRRYYNTALLPTESFNVTLTTTAKYYFTAIAATNKYMYPRRYLAELIICFTINEENDIVYRKGYANRKSCM